MPLDRRDEKYASLPRFLTVIGGESQFSSEKTIPSIIRLGQAILQQFSLAGVKSPPFTFPLKGEGKRDILSSRQFLIKFFWLLGLVNLTALGTAIPSKA
jgi:hypothetical protein